MGCCSSKDRSSKDGAEVGASSVAARGDADGSASVRGPSASASTRRTSREWDVLSCLDWAPHDRLASDAVARHAELPPAAVSAGQQVALSFDSGTPHTNAAVGGGGLAVSDNGALGASATELMLSDLVGSPAPCFGGSATNSPRAASLSRSDAVLHRSQNSPASQSLRGAASSSRSVGAAAAHTFDNSRTRSTSSAGGARPGSGSRGSNGGRVIRRPQGGQNPLRPSAAGVRGDPAA